MNDFPLVAMRNGREQLLHDLSCFIFSELLALPNQLKQLPACAILCYYEYLIIVFEEFEKLDYIRMIH